MVCIENPDLVTYYLKTEVVDQVSSAAVHNREWYVPLTIYLPVLLAGQGAWLYFSAKRLATIAIVSVILLAGFKLVVASFPNKNNMKQVYQMGLEAGSRNAEYFVFEEDKLYGMQFYLNGMMQRLTSTGQEPWAGISVEDLLSSLNGEKIATEYMILANKKKVLPIQRALSDTHLDVQTTENKYWIWYMISQKNNTHKKVSWQVLFSVR